MDTFEGGTKKQDEHSPQGTVLPKESLCTNSPSEDTEPAERASNNEDDTGSDNPMSYKEYHNFGNDASDNICENEKIVEESIRVAKKFKPRSEDFE